MLGSIATYSRPFGIRRFVPGRGLLGFGDMAGDWIGTGATVFLLLLNTEDGYFSRPRIWELTSVLSSLRLGAVG
jgi:hypothetical protein